MRGQQARCPGADAGGSYLSRLPPWQPARWCLPAYRGREQRVRRGRRQRRLGGQRGRPLDGPARPSILYQAGHLGAGSSRSRSEAAAGRQPGEHHATRSAGPEHAPATRQPQRGRSRGGLTSCCDSGSDSHCRNSWSSLSLAQGYMWLLSWLLRPEYVLSVDALPTERASAAAVRSQWQLGLACRGRRGRQAARGSPERIKTPSSGTDGAGRSVCRRTAPGEPRSGHAKPRPMPRRCAPGELSSVLST